MSVFPLPAILTPDITAVTPDVVLADHMVLQADMPVRLWGTCAHPGPLCVRVTEDKTGTSRLFYTDSTDGTFDICLEPTPCGGPYTIDFITGSGHVRSLTDVLFGEVYILGGQSNMGWAMSQCYEGTTDTLRYQEIMDTCENRSIREMLVWPVSSETRVERLTSCRSWQHIQPSTIGNVSACGYFFARRLEEELHVPVGIVSSCMGGTHISTWFPGGVWHDGMISPITRLTVRGVLWYQGEGDPVDYAVRLADLIRIWRQEFENPEMHFHVVQLPRYVNAESWFLCREEDKKVCSLTENCTCSVNIDTGMLPHMRAEGDTLNDDGIHPYQKLEVGYRAADVLLEKVYGLPGTRTSPWLESAEKAEDGAVLLQFANVGEGLTLAGLAGFEAAGADRVYTDALPALLNKTTVRLTCTEVPEIAHIRYGYTNESRYIDGPITDCAQCVCLYNTVSGKKAYPAEQFALSLAGEDGK